MSTRHRTLTAIAVASTAVGALLGSWTPAPANGDQGHVQDFGGASVYQLGSQWHADDGRTLRLADLAGRVRVVALIFTSCSAVCPTLVNELKALDARLSPAARSDTAFVLVSIDPERDTPEALRAYRARMQLDAARFTLLRANASDVRELAAVLGFSYGKPQGAALAHSRLVTILSRRGEIVHQQPGVAEDAARFMTALDQALADRQTRRFTTK